MANQKISVLVVDDDLFVRKSLQRSLSKFGCEVRAAGSIEEGQQALHAQPAELCFIDLNLPDGNGSELVRWGISNGFLKRAYCITGFATRKNIVEAVRAGCVDVVEKPFDPETLRGLVESLQSNDDIVAWRKRFAPEIVGEDQKIVDILRIISSVADSDCTVLVTGESGTGKELIAKAVHNASKRASQPFVALNCAAIPENLIESELFGHTKGAFTGAATQREGHILAANGGTLFLDEIGEMPLAAQAKLLRVLQDGQLTQVGSDRSIPVNLRVVAATNKDLEEMVEEKKFRGDLFYRLNVIHVELPPLRERPSDIILLAQSYLQQFTARLGREVIGLDKSAEVALQQYSWPGNIRELVNAIQRAVLLKPQGTLSATDLRLSSRASKGSAPTLPTVPAVAAAPLQTTPTALPPTPPGSIPVLSEQVTPNTNLNLKSALDDVERQLIMMALERSSGNRTEAAALLGLNRTTLVEKLRKLGG